MRERYYTIMIVPGTKARLFRLRLRRGILAGVVSLVVLGLLTAGLLPVAVFKATSVSQKIASLRSENRELRAASREIEKLREQVAFFESKASKFAAMAGVESIPSMQGVGGLRQEGGPDAPGRDDLQDLKERSGVLRQSFDVLDRVYRDQSLLLASTPSVAPVKGMVAYGFAWRRDPFTGERAFHKGLDIVAPRGTRVKAPADAVVIKAIREPGYGNVVYLSHGNGVVTRYAHLDGFSVRPGQSVNRGDIIGYVGNTGRSLGAHLHYEVLLNNAKVDPSQYILDDHAAY